MAKLGRLLEEQPIRSFRLKAYKKVKINIFM